MARSSITRMFSTAGVWSIDHRADATPTKGTDRTGYGVRMTVSSHPDVPMLTFLGAAGTVRGSRFLLEASSARVLIDAGLFQGLKELRLGTSQLARIVLPDSGHLLEEEAAYQADVVVLESTYGDRRHDDAGALDRFAEAITCAAARGGPC